MGIFISRFRQNILEPFGYEIALSQSPVIDKVKAL